MGNTADAARATLEERNLEANMSDKTRRDIAATQATTSTANAQTSAAARKYAANIQKQIAAIKANGATAGNAFGLTPAQSLALSKAVLAIRSKKTGTDVSTPESYTITYKPAAPTGPGGVVLPGSKPGGPEHFDVSTADYQSGAWKKRIPKGATFQGSAPKGSVKTTVNASSEWTQYKEALGSVMSAAPKLTRTQAVQYLGSLGWPAPKSGK
jgi:hypothetical protein